MLARGITSLQCLVLLLVVTGVAAARPSQNGPRAAQQRCTRFASPQGNDSARGTLHRPLRTAQKLVASLAPGQTGCLLTGRYAEDVSIMHGGRPGRPITLRAAPGDTVWVQGRFWIAESANWVTVSHLHLDGKNATHLPSPTVNGDHATFTYDDVTNDHMGGVNDGDGICFLLGDAGGKYGIARYTTISHSRVHDCGTSDNHNHGIYLAASWFATIEGNWIYDNADRGIQLYPDAHDTLIRNNVIAGNGEGVIFSGDGNRASSNNVLIHNVIFGSRLRWNVEYYWSGPVGSANVVTGNCLYGGEEGDVREPQVGYTATNNVFGRIRLAGHGWPMTISVPAACTAFLPRSVG